LFGVFYTAVVASRFVGWAQKAKRETPTTIVRLTKSSRKLTLASFRLRQLLVAALRSRLRFHNAERSAWVVAIYC